MAAAEQATQRRDQVREVLGRDLDAARYAADRAFRQYDAADPTNRLVAGELEARWNQALVRVAEVESKIATLGAASPTSAIDRATLALGDAQKLPLQLFRDRLKIGGQAAIAIDGDDSLVGWNVCP
jgi:hypothetical protein